MARILAIDYGFKRTGIAVSDPLKIIASGLDTIHSQDLLPFLAKYCSENEVDTIVVGKPLNTNGEATHTTADVVGLIRKLKKLYPEKIITEIDERFTTAMAKKAMIEGGLSKKSRADKGLVDKTSAIIILQTFMLGSV